MDDHRQTAHKNYNKNYGNIRVGKAVATQVSECIKPVGVTMKDFTEALLDHYLMDPEYCREALEWRFGKGVVNSLINATNERQKKSGTVPIRNAIKDVMVH